MTPQEVARLLSALHGAYPHVEIDDSVIAVWANGMALTDYAHAMTAATEWIQTSTWWPTIAEFNGMVRRIRDNDTNSNGHVRIAASPSADVAAAAAAFHRGYRRARVAVGDTPELIDAKAASYLSRFTDA